MAEGGGNAENIISLVQTGGHYVQGVHDLVNGKPDKAAHRFVEGAVNLIPKIDKVDAAIKFGYELAGKGDKAPTVADIVDKGVKYVGEGAAKGVYDAVHHGEDAKREADLAEFMKGSEARMKANHEKAVKEREARAKEHPENKTPGEITLPEVKIEVSKAELAQIRFQSEKAKIAAMDPKAVIVDGVVKPPASAVQLDGTVTHVHHNDKTGLTTIDFKDKMGHPRALSFKEPMGHDERGNPTHHPLQAMAEKLEAHKIDYNKMQFQQDGKGNIDFAVGNPIVQERGHDGPGVAKELMQQPQRGQALANAGVGR